MCGLVAWSSEAGDSGPRCIEGLKRLQYRGYDSYGFAFLANGQLDVLRSLESLDDFIESLPASSAVMGHTRWATHGGVTLSNCHPHLGESVDGAFALAHNGIVENYEDLRERCHEAGESDTAIIVSLLSAELEGGGDRLDAVCAVARELEGRNTFCVLFADNELIAFRSGSPLILGRAGSDAALRFVALASDTFSISPYCDRCFPLPDRSVVAIRGAGVRVLSLDAQKIDIAWQPVDRQEQALSTGEYPHYMIKEIMEQWQTVSRQAAAISGRLDRLVDAISAARTVFVTGAGGAAFTARQIAWMIRETSGLRAIDVPAYEMASVRALASPGDVVIGISQSGETADTLDAIDCARGWGLTTAALVNMPHSTLGREADMTFESQAGPEICVLSTKSATSQLTFGHLLAGRLASMDVNVDTLCHQLACFLCADTLRVFERAASRLVDASSAFVLGRGQFHAPAMITALNIKEASYIHAEAFAAGELKHGVIALIEPGVPVIVFAPSDDPYMIGVAAEVKARGAFVIGIGDSESALFDVLLPLPGDAASRSIASVIPGQLLAYFAATLRGLNPDRPRNLAKSVTVQ